MTRKEWLSSGCMRVCAANAASFCVEKNAKYEGEAGPACMLTLKVLPQRYLDRLPML